MNTTIDLKTAKTIEAMNQKINHMDNAVTGFFNKMSDVLERQLGDDEVYAAVIAPEIELTITPLANVRSYLPCFDEADSCYSISEDAGSLLRPSSGHHTGWKALPVRRSHLCTLRHRWQFCCTYHRRPVPDPVLSGREQRPSDGWPREDGLHLH